MNKLTKILYKLSINKYNNFKKEVNYSVTNLLFHPYNLHVIRTFKKSYPNRQYI